MRNAALIATACLILACIGSGGAAPAPVKMTVQAHCIALGDHPQVWLTVANDSDEDIDVSRFTLSTLCRFATISTPKGPEPLYKITLGLIADPGPLSVDLVRITAHGAASLVSGSNEPLSEAAEKVVIPGSAPILKLSGTVGVLVAHKDRDTPVAWEGRVCVPPKK